MPSIRSLVVPALLIGVVVCAFLPSSWLGWTRGPHKIVETMVGPVSQLMSTVAGSVGGEQEDPIHLADLQKANRLLQEQYARNLRLENEVIRLRRENAALQDLQERFSRTEYRTIMADVMGRSIESDVRALTINRGQRAGLSQGIPAVIDANVVGRLTSVGRVTATVELITTPGTKLNAIITPPTWSGSLPAARRRLVQFDAMPDGTLQALAPDDLPINIDDIAHLRDDSWPNSVNGMILGRVINVESLDDPPLRIRITIQPLRTLQYLDEVTLIVPKQD
jgi:cell shape-determining protein MreC